MDGRIHSGDVATSVNGLCVLLAVGLRESGHETVKSSGYYSTEFSLVSIVSKRKGNLPLGRSGAWIEGKTISHTDGILIAL